MNLHLATFRFDATPPKGHPLCGGWIRPAEEVDDALEGAGVVLLGAGAPVVLCAVDWTGILNGAHVRWREALADAAHTASDRVAVHCVHQHNAPFACLESQAKARRFSDLPDVVDPEFFEACLERAAQAVRAGLRRARRLTGVATGKARVERVASNRRTLGANGKVQFWRGSSCTDEAIRALPEGLIDPWIRTIALYDGESQVAGLHYYATHPMSYYGDGRVSSDFAGLARKRRGEETPGCTHIYLTGCAGNVAAGKYNDGSKAARRELTDRLYAGLAASEKDLEPREIVRAEWKTSSVLPPARSDFNRDSLEAVLAGKDQRLADRLRSAMKLSWLDRVERGSPKIIVSALHVNDAVALHLPGECFVEYQLRAQAAAPDRFVATAAYGDGGPWYVPVREAYLQGGYEVDAAYCDPPVDDVLTEAIKSVLTGC